MGHGRSVAIRMKKVLRPRNLRTPWCHLNAKNEPASLHVGVTRGLEEMKKAHAWLGRVIEHLEYEATTNRYGEKG